MSSRGRSSSPFSHRRASSPYSSSSSTSSFMNTSGRFVPRSCSTSGSSFYGSTNGYGARSTTPSRSQSDPMYSGPRGCRARSPVGFPSSEDVITDPLDMPRSSGDSISVTVRFRPINDREYQRGDEIAWYPDGDKIVRNVHNLATAYAFDKVFGPNAASEEVYDVAARPVVKAAMEGVNGTVFAYGVTSSGKTHTMHGDQNAPGIIPLAIKDVFSIIQDSPGREFLLRVSYLEIYNEVINDLLDPTGQNLRVREDAQGTYVEGIKEEVVLSPGHALSFIAAGEEHRHVGSNNFNMLSSRSHTIFTLMIESSARGDEYDGVIFSQLNLIDLAGSESSKTETTGLRRKEGSYINKSLLTLGTVIGKLSEGKASHIPYRDSKLTRLLQSSISGRGHVSLICTVTPASSSMEETHNTLKFANRAKRVEIYASRNKIIDEKSLIKKYQREISSLKQELDQLKRGMLVGVSHEEIMSLRQQLEEGQVKMQSRLEEEEEAKAALMSRIQRLTKLILVSTKNAIPGYLGDEPGHHCHSAGKDDKSDDFRDNSLVREMENKKESPSSTVVDASGDWRQTRSSSKWNDQLSPAGSTVSGSNKASELIGGSTLQTNGMTSDEVDLLVEQVKMLSGDIALSTSTLKRLVEQSVNDTDASKTQIQNLECEILEKRRQMRVLEERIIQSGETSNANASLVDMQQTIMRLMTQYNEKGFELEIKAADNRILQEQLQNKCAENEELQGKIEALEQQLSSPSGVKASSSAKQRVTEEYIEDLKMKVESQEVENEKMKLQHAQLFEENSGLRVRNQKLSEEATYAKELASAAAVEIKNLAGEVTKLSLQNAKIEKELQAARDLAHSRAVVMPIGIGGNPKYSDGMKPIRKIRFSGRANEMPGNMFDDFDSYSLDPDDLKMELQARKQREVALEAALADKENAEVEYQKKVEVAKRREAALENDLANMWVLVAKLKKEGGATLDSKSDASYFDGDLVSVQKTDDVKEILMVTQSLESIKSVKEEPLVARLKARIQEMREKELKNIGNGDAILQLCKVCFESSTAAILLPCRHFCWPSSPEDLSSSPIGNTFSSPGRPRRRRQRSSSSYSTPPPPPSRFNPATTPNDSTPTPASSRRRVRQKPPISTPVAETPSSNDDGPLSSEAGEGFDGEDAPPMFVWGTNISVQDVNAAIVRFLRNFRESYFAVASADIEGKYMRMVNHVLEIEGDWLDVDARDVFDYDPDLYNKMVRYPLEVLAIFDIVLMDMVSRINPMFEKHVQARIFNLKTSTCMRNLNPSDIEKMVSLKGMIIRCSSIIPEIREAVFKCLVCRCYSDPIVVDRGRITEPAVCQKEDCKAKNSMALVHNRCRFADKQIVRLQETPDEIPDGGAPHTVSLLMHDKLVDTGKPGDRVEVTGIYRAMSVRVGPTQRTVKSLFKTYIDCLHIKKTDKSRMQCEDPLEVENGPCRNDDDAPFDYQEKVEQLKELSKQPDIYDRLTKSLAPNIWELDDVKKGLLCQLFGGNALKLASGASFRGDINILLVGDPGTSKSQLLQYIHKLSPRGIYTSGRGSSAVGLTAYVTKDPETGETVLESGALVLSDRGICCIDEFDKMSDSARSMLHEVMEQQTVSIAKAGIIASLNARTSVLACANPIGSRYNPRLSVIDNIHLLPTLLSRFDLIYLILDKADEQTDRRLAKHIVALHFENLESAQQGTLEISTLTAYVSYARKHIHPKLSDEAAEDLTHRYVEMRRRGNFPGSSKKVITATPRQIESLIRLSEALARMRFSQWVEKWDVAEAFRLLEVALQQSATDHSTGTIDMDLITTGISASERMRREQLVSATRNLIMEKMELGGPAVRTLELLEELKKQSSGGEVHLSDLRNALATLASEGFVSVHGDGVKRI
ncbi:hypothetical protein Nepgr_004624 [Nepenthes gracilis]|uniref:DNA helicase n=2 Tax=Magnoliopsida TaxID=3398 RepID=A0AAD3S1R8_NEPGR|nr:hypothetical protein Nepgr_004624 [Nepenthes gracilis]